jgi:replicative DNA helicase
MGKSTLAINMAEHAALKDGIRASVAIFSLEMPAEQILTRMLSSVGSVHLGNIRSGKLSEDDWPRITGRHQAAAGRQDLHRRHAGAHADELRARSRRIKREHGPRSHRRGLPAAHDGAGHEEKSRHGNLGDLARP